MAIISQNAEKHSSFGFFEQKERKTPHIRTPEDQDEGNQESRESGRIALITRYSDNQCLVTRYPDAHYKKCKTKPISKKLKCT